VFFHISFLCYIFKKKSRHTVIADAPEAPENLQASDIHADHMKLSWLPPSDDGGSEITGQFTR